MDEAVKKKRGRPVKGKPKNIDQHFRFDSETCYKLEMLKLESNKSKNEIVAECIAKCFDAREIVYDDETDEIDEYDY